MHTRRFVLLVVFLVIALNGCQVDRVPPAIVSTLPLPNSQGVSLDSTITISFSEPMDRLSVEKSLQIEPSVLFDIRWQGSVMHLAPRQLLLPGTKYSIGFAAAPSDVAGNKLPEFSLVLTTADYRAAYNSVESLAWLLDNRTLLFTAEKNGIPRLQLLNVDSGAIRELDLNPGHQIEPAINKEGTMVAYVGGTHEPQLYLHNLTNQTTTQILLSINGDMPGSPQFSPDGKLLALYGILGRSDVHSDIFQSLWVYDLVNKNFILVSPTGASVRFLGFSGDSARVFFLNTFEEYNHSYNFRYDLWETVVATGETRRLSEQGKIHNFDVGDFGTADLRFVYGTWETQDIDSSIVAYPRDIHLMYVEPPVQRTLLTGGRNAQPTFAPSGKQILFISNRGSRDHEQELFIMDDQGKNIRQLTFSTHPKHLPRWSPDGQRIAFVEMQNEFPIIYVINADGTGLRRVIR